MTLLIPISICTAIAIYLLLITQLKIKETITNKRSANFTGQFLLIAVIASLDLVFILSLFK